MNTIRVVGIDIAKSVFQVYVWMVDSSVAWNKKVTRQKLLDTLRQFEPGTVMAMEACSTSHFWGRTLSSIGFSVRLIPAQHVKVLSEARRTMQTIPSQSVKPHAVRVSTFGATGYQSAAQYSSAHGRAKNRAGQPASFSAR